MLANYEPIKYNSIITAVINSVDSQNTRRAYKRSISDFMTWYTSRGVEGLTKSTVQAYKTELRESGLEAGNINQRLTAIKKLAEEAADNGALDPTIAAGILRVKGIRREGKRLGRWLTKEQAQELLNSPDISTLKGIRDRAILAVLLGAGLRREEASILTFEHIQQREGRWVIVDLVGKRNKMRSIPMPSWCKAAIDAWIERAGITTGVVFRRIRGNRLAGEKMTAQAIYNLVAKYSNELGYGIAAHDLRRTFAKLSHKGGAAIEQIQLSLGHASIKTTEIYLGITQDMNDAPCDRLGLSLGGQK